MRERDVAERVAEMALAEPYGRALWTVRDHAASLLAEGYPREELYDDFGRAVEIVRLRSSPDEAEEAEDSILDVMDFLAGFCSNHMKL